MAVGGDARRDPRPRAGRPAVDADRVPRQRRDHEPHPVRRRIARPPHVLRMVRPAASDCRCIALMPAGVSSAGASITGPNGPVATCVLHGANTTGIASSILGGENAVVVVPRRTARRRSPTPWPSPPTPGPSNWSFNVDPNAPLVPAEAAPTNATVLGSPTPFQSVTPFRFADSRLGHTLTRLPAGQPVRVQIAGAAGHSRRRHGASARTSRSPSRTRDGYFTTFNCAGVASHRSRRSTSAPAKSIANQAVVALDARRAVRLFVRRCRPDHRRQRLRRTIGDVDVRPGRPPAPRRLAGSGTACSPARSSGVVVAGGASPAPLGSRRRSR